MLSKNSLAGLAIAATLALVAATPAFAYVGPGAGLSLLSALWGVLLAVLAAVAFIVIWPLRRLLKRRRSPMPTANPRVGSPGGHGDPAEASRSRSL
ncbi:MAG: hypothetical protein ACREDZ_06070 [Kiloniellales bacterium]